MIARPRLAVWLLVGVVPASCLGQTEPSRPDTLDEAVWKRLLAFDQKAAAITDLSAEFRQEKFTALLKKPLVSTGRVRMTPAAVRWDTRLPRPSSMLVTGAEIRLHYPEQSLLEIYPVQGRFREIAASPVLRLPLLVKQFTPHRIAPRELDAQGDEAEHLALRLVPREDAVRGHLAGLRVLLAAESGNVIKVEMTDADGERTVLALSGVKLNGGVKDGDLELRVPEGTTISRPLKGAPAGKDGRR